MPHWKQLFTVVPELNGWYFTYLMLKALNSLPSYNAFWYAHLKQQRSTAPCALSDPRATRHWEARGARGSEPTAPGVSLHLSTRTRGWLFTRRRSFRLGLTLSTVLCSTADSDLHRLGTFCLLWGFPRAAWERKRYILLFSLEPVLPRLCSHTLIIHNMLLYIKGCFGEKCSVCRKLISLLDKSKNNALVGW